MTHKMNGTKAFFSRYSFYLNLLKYSANILTFLPFATTF